MSKAGDDDKTLVLSSPAPVSADDAGDDAGLTDAELARDQDADELFAAYAHWCRTRGFYAPPPVNGSLLGKLTKKGNAKPMTGGPDAACSAEMAALHLAIMAQPADALDRRVFTLHYLYSVRSVKEAAHALDVSKAHWYRLLRGFRERVLASAKAILSSNLLEAERLPSRSGKRQIQDDAD